MCWNDPLKRARQFSFGANAANTGSVWTVAQHLPSDMPPVRPFLQEQRRTCKSAINHSTPWIQCGWCARESACEFESKCVGVCRIGGETQTHVGKKCLPVSAVSRILITNGGYEYEYESSLSRMPEHVLITAEACVWILIGSLLGVQQAAWHTMLVSKVWKIPLSQIFCGQRFHEQHVFILNNIMLPINISHLICTWDWAVADKRLRWF